MLIMEHMGCLHFLFTLQGNIHNMILGGILLRILWLYEMSTSFISTGTAIFTHSIQIYSLGALP